MRQVSDVPTQKPDWIGVDWGTSNFRAWGFDNNNSLLCEERSEIGMSRLRPHDFEGALLKAIGGWLPDIGEAMIFACGMVGAKEGWVEAPYAAVPCRAQGSLVEATARDERLRVFVLSGLCQSAPCDVMRGEETQIAGYLAGHPGWSGMICLPGTHAKWVQIKNGHVVAFQTYMTGELFAVCKEVTVLRHSITSDELSIDVFEDAVTALLRAPERAASQLFSVRANDLMTQTAPSDGTSRLSGILIGTELVSARASWDFDDVVLIGAKELCRRYECALRLTGVSCTIKDAQAMTIAGLSAARQSCLVA